MATLIGTTYMTASALKGMLCFINPTATPKIAFDKDELAQPLIDKVTKALGDRDGSQTVSITFLGGEEELARQFNGVAGNIASIYSQIEYSTNPNR